MAVARRASGERLPELLSRAARRVEAQLAAILDADGLTVDQWRALDVLVGAESGIAMSDLAEGTGATGPTLTRTVDKLVNTSLAYREVDPEDRRRVLVYPTNRGRATRRRIAPRIRAVERSLLAAVDDHSGLLAALDRIAR